MQHGVSLVFHTGFRWQVVVPRIFTLPVGSMLTPVAQKSSRNCSTLYFEVSNEFCSAFVNFAGIPGGRSNMRKLFGEVQECLRSDARLVPSISDPLGRFAPNKHSSSFFLPKNRIPGKWRLIPWHSVFNSRFRPYWLLPQFRIHGGRLVQFNNWDQALMQKFNF